MHVCVEQIHRLPDSLPKWIQRSGVIGTPSRMWREPKRTAGDSIKLLKSLSYTREWESGYAELRLRDRLTSFRLSPIQSATALGMPYLIPRGTGKVPAFHSCANLLQEKTNRPLRRACVTQSIPSLQRNQNCSYAFTRV